MAARELVGVRVGKGGLAVIDGIAEETGANRSDVLRALLKVGLESPETRRKVKADMVALAASRKVRL